MSDASPDQVKVREPKEEDEEDSIEKFIEERVEFAMKHPDLISYDDPKVEARIIHLINKRIAEKRAKQLAKERENAQD